MRDHCNALPGDAVETQQVRSGRFRDCDQPARTVRGRPQQQSPERQIEPPEILRMTFVLEVVEDGYLPASRQDRRGESGIEQNIQPIAGRFERQDDLLPQDPRRAKASVHGLRLPVKICLLGNQVCLRLEVRKDQVLVDLVELGQRRKQLAQVNLGAADAPRNQVQGINANADPDARHAATGSPWSGHPVPPNSGDSAPTLAGIAPLRRSCPRRPRKYYPDRRRSSRSGGPASLPVPALPRLPEICAVSHTPWRFATGYGRFVPTERLAAAS